MTARDGTGVAVIGGGLIGACVAAELAWAGERVTVFDPDRPGAAWAASAGLLTPTHEDLRGTPLDGDAVLSLALWPDFARRLEAASGQAVHHRPAPPGRGFGPLEGQVHPPSVRAAALAGLEVRREEVLHLQEDPRGLKVRTDAGEEVFAAGVLACGAWSAAFGLPVRAVWGEALLLPGSGAPLPRYAPRRAGRAAHRRYALDRPDGVYVGATARPQPSPAPGGWSDRWLLGVARDLLGDLPPGQAVRGRLAGARPVTPDGQPIVGPHPDWARVFVATGHGRHGALLAPLTARRALDWLRAGVAG
ncbi:NAD(P)/FAD-dependent oxidoreductase [Deinococcus aquiradiocola]|uniref:Oxidoreductase n=1 Tax=Deinococcus aquiradiocola TaxID=393059 RepID=A0A917PBM4_9DEIO|nr:FAD-dependent oxidoreductase [Deinococcus aquiradiocola]GGJ69759.1 oxidoreductase [Deinococcus aquiradiocola]